MSTALGDFLICIDEDARPDFPPRPLDPSRWPAWRRTRACLKECSPAAGISVIYSGDVSCVIAGQRGGIGLAREPEHGGNKNAPAAAVAQALQSWLRDPDWEPQEQRGRYVFVFWDGDQRSVKAFTDPFRTYPVFYQANPGRILCASDLRLILATLETPPSIDLAALYHYLNFGYIPAPHCPVRGIAKLEAGFCLEARPGKLALRRIFDVPYPEDLGGKEGERALELRDRIVQTVSDYRPAPQSSWGTFLSGGTDSSSINGILARSAANTPVESFSIGFVESGYDELSYSHIAAKHFGLKAHERRVGEADAIEIIPGLVRGFDEPFGNSSAIPTFYCADLAYGKYKELLIAGDGGDEIFGGNERYAKDKVLAWYHGAPRPVRMAGSILAQGLDGIDLHIANRVRNIIRRGALPNPDRFYSDDSFASDHFEALLSPDFRQAVARDDSLEIQRDIFARADTPSELHRLMYLDLKLTIAESDVVKVVRSAKLAGVDVAFPYLDRHLVEYTGRLPDYFKVNRLKKRYLFKMAMSDILPEEILHKKKQGFGLPVAVWLRRGGALRAMVCDNLLSRHALERGYFRPAFLQQLIERHERGLWDHSAEIFRLLMLELWHREYIDHA